jgi:hypothetical protein
MTATSGTGNEKIAFTKSVECGTTIRRSNSYCQKITDKISIGAKAGFKEFSSISSGCIHAITEEWETSKPQEITKSQLGSVTHEFPIANGNRAALTFPLYSYVILELTTIKALQMDKS